MNDSYKKTLSVIISLKEDSRLLSQTLSSLTAQVLPIEWCLEVIVIDSNSSDCAWETASLYNEKLNLIWTSEFDRNIYEAWNKGLRKASGHYVCFVGAGDTICHGALEKLLSHVDFQKENQIITSQSRFCSNKKNVDYVSGKPFIFDEFKYKFTTNHSCLLYNRNIFYRYGNFSEQYGVAGDYHFLLRVGRKLNATHVDIISCNYLLGGISNSRLSVHFDVFKARRDLKIFGFLKNSACFFHAIAAMMWRSLWGY